MTMPTSLLLLIHIAQIVAAVCATSVPIIYVFSPWYVSKLGRAFMLQAVAFAAAVDLTVLFQFWRTMNIEALFWVNLVVLGLIAVATAVLTIVIFRLNRTSSYVAKHTARSTLMSEPVANPEPVVAESAKSPLVSNKVYDKLKPFTTIVLPGVGTLYFALSQIWGLPGGPQVVGSITAIVTFLGLVLGLSTRSYNNSDAKYDGSIEVEHQDDKKVFSLNLHSDPDTLDQKKDVTFKVQPK